MSKKSKKNISFVDFTELIADMDDFMGGIIKPDMRITAVPKGRRSKTATLELDFI